MGAGTKITAIIEITKLTARGIASNRTGERENLCGQFAQNERKEYRATEQENWKRR